MVALGSAYAAKAGQEDTLVSDIAIRDAGYDAAGRKEAEEIRKLEAAQGFEEGNQVHLLSTRFASSAEAPHPV